MNAKKVLIIEDDKMLCTIFEMFIKEIGYEHIGTVKTCCDAISLCEISMPDIVLMDIHLDGDKSGIEIARTLDEKFNLPVIYVTGDSDDDTLKNAILKNTYGFLTKPLNRNLLKITVDFALTKHKLFGN